MNSINVICPDCGHEFLIEDYRMDEDDLACEKCGALIIEDDDVSTTWQRINNAIARSPKFKSALLPVKGICAYCGDPDHDCDNCIEKDFDDYVDSKLTNVPGGTVRMARWVLSKVYVLTQADVDILDGSRARRIRCDVVEDAEIKNLYDMYKAL